MKKFTFTLIGICALFFASCDGGRAERERQDSIRRADSIAQVEAAMAAAEQARLDSLRQDSIEKVEKAMAAVPSFNTLISTDSEALFKKLGYTITRKKVFNDQFGEYETYITATYQPSEGIFLQYKEDFWEPFEFTIKGLPEARDKFYQDAKAYVAKQKRKGDHWTQTWYAKLNGDKVVVFLWAD